MSLVNLFSRLNLSVLRNNLPCISMQTAGLKTFELPAKYDHLEYPEKARLRIYEKVPQYPANMRAFKMHKRLKLMRGPEETHNFLLHKQYGVMAMTGGRLQYGHFEMIRFVTNRKLPSGCSSIYRVDPPWQPVTKKTQGMRMGAGKGAIHHYVTPVKAGRIIMEVVGPVEFKEVQKSLQEIAHKLPFRAMVVTEEKLEKMRLKEEEQEKSNLNPWTLKYIIQNNLGGCANWISPYDRKWFGKYR